MLSITLFHELGNCGYAYRFIWYGIIALLISIEIHKQMESKVLWISRLFVACDFPSYSYNLRLICVWLLYLLRIYFSLRYAIADTRFKQNPIYSEIYIYRYILN